MKREKIAFCCDFNLYHLTYFFQSTFEMWPKLQAFALSSLGSYMLSQPTKFKGKEHGTICWNNIGL